MVCARLTIGIVRVLLRVMVGSVSWSSVVTMVLQTDTDRIDCRWMSVSSWYAYVEVWQVYMAVALIGTFFDLKRVEGFQGWDWFSRDAAWHGFGPCEILRTVSTLLPLPSLELWSLTMRFNEINVCYLIW